MKLRENYLNNPKLRASNVAIPLTDHQKKEIIKCKNDIFYFLENYVQIVTLDHGKQPFVVRDYQHEFIKSMADNRFTIGMMARQMGKSTSFFGFALHYCLFNKDKKIAVLGNTEKVAKKLLRDFKLAYELLPRWMQQGVVEWNKKSIELENGTKLFADATGGGSVRGEALNVLMLDEFAHISNTAADDFISSVMPTVSSGKTSKIIIISTPKGMNHFYKLWAEAEEGKNGYVPVKADWRKHPERDQAWANAERSKIGETRFAQEYDLDFLGSSGTLIAGAALRNIPTVRPIKRHGDLAIYELPKTGHSYLMTVDTAHGKGFDYSAFVVVDITEHPYKVVCTFNSNEVDPLIYPQHIYNAATQYNDASVLVEINDVGQVVSNSLHNDFEYENLLFCFNSGRNGQTIGYGGGKQSYPGVRTTKTVKAVGCSNLKTIIENEELVINSFDILHQLQQFIKKGNSFEADEGENDDLVACLFLFGWATTQNFFMDLSDTDIKKELFKNQREALEEELAPVGFWSSNNCYGVETGFVDEEGIEWEKV